MMKSTLIKDLYGEIERLKAGRLLCFCFTFQRANKAFPSSRVFRTLGMFTIEKALIRYFDQRFTLHGRKMEFIYRRKDIFKKRAKRR